MAPSIPQDDDRMAAEAAIDQALLDLLAVERGRIRLASRLADGDTHRPGQRTDLLVDIGGARREVEVARRNLDHAICVLMGGETVNPIFAMPASAETAMADRLSNNRSVAAIEAHLARPAASLPKVTSPASA